MAYDVTNVAGRALDLGDRQLASGQTVTVQLLTNKTRQLLSAGLVTVTNRKDTEEAPAPTPTPTTGGKNYFDSADYPTAQAAINAGVGSTVYLRKKDYTEYISFPLGTPARIVGDGEKTRVLMTSGTNLLNIATGSLTPFASRKLLAQDALAYPVVGDSYLPKLIFTQPHGLAVGDYVKVCSTTPLTLTLENNTRGEIRKVKIVDSPTQVTLARKLRDDYTVAASAYVLKVTFGAPMLIEGMKLENPTPDTNTLSAYTGCGIFANLMRGLKMRDVLMEGIDERGLHLQDCIDFDCEFETRNQIENSPLGRHGYGCTVGLACQDGDIHVDADRCRHAFTTNGRADAGEPDNIRVTGRARNTTSYPWDTHGEGKNVHFTDCRADGTDCTNAGDTQYGFNIRSDDATITRGYVHSAIGAALRTAAGTSGVIVNGLIGRSTKRHPAPASGQGARIEGSKGQFRGLDFLGTQDECIRFAAGANDNRVRESRLGNAGRGGFTNVGVNFVGTCSGNHVSAELEDLTTGMTQSGSTADCWLEVLGARNVATITAAANLGMIRGEFGVRKLTELSADPPAPAANEVFMYSRDNGSGKTQVCARFPTGAVQVLATEP